MSEPTSGVTAAAQVFPVETNTRPAPSKRADNDGDQDSKKISDSAKAEASKAAEAPVSKPTETTGNIINTKV